MLPPAHAGRCAGGRLLLLFDWALPLLGPAGRQLGWASQYWVLLALAQGLGLSDPLTLAEQAGPAMAACTAMLEAEGTAPHLLGPLLGVVQQVRRGGVAALQPVPVPVLTGLPVPVLTGVHHTVPSVLQPGCPTSIQSCWRAPPGPVCATLGGTHHQQHRPGIFQLI